jgi:hypothetical protein
MMFEEWGEPAGPVPGITVTPTSGLVTTEAGGTDTFTVVLDTQPTASVSINLASDDTSEGTVSPASLTFTTGNWNITQTVTVTGVQDLLLDGNVPYNIVTAAAVSGDGNYSGIDPANVSVTNIDDEVPPPVRVQLAMILDASGSIDAGEWTIMVNGLAQALNNTECVPHDGSVELTVIVFASSATVGLGPLVLTDANAADVVYNITNLSRSGIGSSTCISCGLCLAADTLHDSPNFNASVKQAINLVTDGAPNYCSCSGGTCDYSGSSCNLASAQASAVCALNYTLTLLGMTADQDELDAEGIGITDANRNWLRDSIVWPQPGYLAPPFDQGTGWLRVFASFEEFVPSLCEKFHIVIEEGCSLNVTSDGCCPIIVGTMDTVEAGATGNFTVPCGTNVTLVADCCNPCCVFDYWTGDVPGGTNSSNPITITMSDNKTVTGTCHWLTYNLTVESDGCCPITVSPGGSVDADESHTFTNIPCGTNVTLTANNSTCCAFDSWEVTAAFLVLGAIAIDGGENIIVITMDSNYTAVAHCDWICGSIGDTIFYDNNDNGIQDPGEGGIEGVTVELYEDDVVYGVFDPEWMGGNTDDLVATTETDVGGVYLFPDLAPGCYWVWVNETTLPPGVTLTTGDNPLYYCVAEGEAYEGADFGYLGATLPVGGTAYPINKLAILAPWMALAAVIAGATIFMRRRRAQS